MTSPAPCAEVEDILAMGKNAKRIEAYIKNQLQEDLTEEDLAADQLTLKEYTDPFMGELVNVGK